MRASLKGRATRTIMEQTESLRHVTAVQSRRFSAASTDDLVFSELPRFSAQRTACCSHHSRATCGRPFARHAGPPPVRSDGTAEDSVDWSRGC